MSVTLNLTERQLKFGLWKLALSLTSCFGLIAVVATLLAGRGQNIAVTFLLTCVAFSFLTHGALAALKVVDWFEARRSKNHG